MRDAMHDFLKVTAGLSVLFGSMLVAPAAHAELTGQLSITVEGLRSNEGAVCFKVFSGGQGFPNRDDSAVRRDCVPITEIPLTVSFEGLAFGSYAIAIYHDSNGDGQLNRGMFGMPTEGYGFSNDPVVTTGPAKFQEAVFLLVGPETGVTIQMRYPS